MRKLIFLIAAIFAFSFTAMAQDAKPKLIEFGGVFAGGEYQENAQQVFKSFTRDKFAAKVTTVIKIRPLRKRAINFRFSVVQPANRVSVTGQNLSIRAPLLRFSIDTRIL